jgi:hypothetical protein
VLVVVPLVWRMPVSTVQVVDVIAVLHCLVAAAVAMGVVMSAVDDVHVGIVLVDVIVMVVVEVPVMQVVDVVAVLDRHVPAAGAVVMIVVGVNLMGGATHRSTFSSGDGNEPRPPPLTLPGPEGDQPSATGAPSSTPTGDG